MGQEYVQGLQCTICGAVYGADELEYVCPRHGVDGTLDVMYDYESLGRRVTLRQLLDDAQRSMWRYLPLLPVDANALKTLGERVYSGGVTSNPLWTVGWTPLYPAPHLAERLGIRELWIKDDSRNPTGSLKDRASAVAVVKARERGYRVITTASTGNAAAALAGLCAAVGQMCVLFVPRSAPAAKIAQLLVYGATVLLVDGSYDDSFELCLKAAPEFGWYNRSTAYNPYMSEGKKTVAYEICEQLTFAKRPQQHLPEVLQTPDRIVVPVGDGCIIGGIYKGLRDLLALGWIEHCPRLLGVQAEGSSSLVDAWERGLEGWEMQPVEAYSLADSIVAALPRDRNKALRAVRETNGAFVRVSDQEILAAIPELARGVGVFVEPAAAAAYAGLVKARADGLVSAGERVVVLATGSGLKDVPSAMKAVPTPPVIAPDLSEVRRALANLAKREGS